MLQSGTKTVGYFSTNSPFVFLFTGAAVANPLTMTIPRKSVKVTIIRIIFDRLVSVCTLHLTVVSLLQTATY
jgi:hypothetical protein